MLAVETKLPPSLFRLRCEINNRCICTNVSCGNEAPTIAQAP